MSKKLFTVAVRRAIEDSGVSRYAIFKATGIDQGLLSRFVNGKAGLSMEAHDTLADYLGWKITIERKPRRKGARKK